MAYLDAKARAQQSASLTKEKPSEVVSCLLAELSLNPVVVRIYRKKRRVRISIVVDIIIDLMAARDNKLTAPYTDPPS